MRQRPIAQATLFETADTTPSPPLPAEVQAKAMKWMVQWMQTVAEALHREVDDDQDHL